MVGQGALGGTVQLADNTYDVALDFQTPRAQVVAWKLMCNGTEVANGSVGEPFEQYRARRIAELKKDRANERSAAGAVTSLLVGAVTPRAKVGPVTARVDDRGLPPGGSAAEGRRGVIDPDAAGAVVAGSIDDRVELPPGDVGAGKLTVRAHLAAAGACSVVVLADDPNVIGTYRITRVHDLDGEARERVVAANVHAVEVRTRVATLLVTEGADGEARERRRLAFEAEAERRHLAVSASAERHRIEFEAAGERRRIAEQAEAERRHAEDERARIAAERLVAIQIAAEAQQRHELEIAIAAQRQIAIDARTRIYGELVLWGADAGLRARRAAAAEAYAEHVERAVAAQVTLALNTRAQLRGYLVGIGAVEKPPMPAPIAEDRGAVPFGGAVWIEGHWTWYGTTWQWTKGGWKDPGHFGETGGESIPVVVTAPPPVVVETPPPVVVVTPVVAPPTVIDVRVRVPTIVVHEHPHPTPPPKRNDHKPKPR